MTWRLASKTAATASGVTILVPGTCEGIRWMRVCHGVTAVFDDPKLVSSAGLAPVLVPRLPTFALLSTRRAGL